MERWLDNEWKNRMTIRLDFSNLMADFIGQERGITRDEIDGLVSRATAIAWRASLISCAGGVVSQADRESSTTSASPLIKVWIPKACTFVLIILAGGGAIQISNRPGMRQAKCRR